MVIKHRFGTLAVIAVAFRDQCLAAGAALLPVFDGHVIETAQLPLVHQDPFAAPRSVSLLGRKRL
ncbi:putative pilT protein, N-terminal [Synechococcus sp. WH 8103]|nr:putative pilT protein, N-terminal [Synechococcus sp. WH 8103]